MSKLTKIVNKVILPIIAGGSLATYGALYLYDRGYSDAQETYSPVLREQKICIRTVGEVMDLQEEINKELDNLIQHPTDSQSSKRIEFLLSRLKAYKQRLNENQSRVSELEKQYKK